MSNRQLEDIKEEYFNRKLAAELGISYDDLILLEWDIDTNTSDDGLVYECIVRFGEESPRKILDKISRLQGGFTVRLQSSIFEDYEDFE